MSIAIAILFVLLGFAIKNGRMYNLIAGYNTMSKEEQSKFDIEAIATVFRNVMFCISAILILGYIISHWLDNSKIEVYVAIPTVIIAVIYLIVVSNSSKYKTE